MLKINNLTKHYKGSNKGVTDISLHIEAGDIYAFIGHNGAGKTTTIKSICGLLDFDSGAIYVDGVSIKDNPIECKKKIANRLALVQRCLALQNNTLRPRFALD